MTVPANAEATIINVKKFAADPSVGDAAIGQPEQQPATSGKKGMPVVKLSDPARVRATPFVINKIHV